MRNLDSKEEKAGRRKPNIHHQRGDKRSKKKGGGVKAVKFTFPEMEERDPVIEEIPENEVNLATRQINLANAIGVGDWERKNWAEE